jgi:hypothetical protein
MTRHETKRLKPFLRDAAVSFIPEMTDDHSYASLERLQLCTPTSS